MRILALGVLVTSLVLTGCQTLKSAYTSISGKEPIQLFNGKDLTDWTVKINGFTISSIQAVERYTPNDYSNTAAAEPYTTQTATAKISKDNEVVIDVNKEGLYQIYKIVLKGN